MTCPHCHRSIPDSTLARHLAAKGGRKSRRTITPDQRAAMEEGKRAKKGALAGDPGTAAVPATEKSGDAK